MGREITEIVPENPESVGQARATFKRLQQTPHSTEYCFL